MVALSTYRLFFLEWRSVPGSMQGPFQILHPDLQSKMAVMPGALLIDLARRQHAFMICSMMKPLNPCLVALLHAVAALGTTPGPALSPTADSKHWTLQVSCWKLSSVLRVYMVLFTCA